VPPACHTGLELSIRQAPTAIASTIIPAEVFTVRLYLKWKHTKPIFTESALGAVSLIFSSGPHRHAADAADGARPDSRRLAVYERDSTSG